MSASETSPDQASDAATGQGLSLEAGTLAAQDAMNGANSNAVASEDLDEKMAGVSLSDGLTTQVSTGDQLDLDIKSVVIDFGSCNWTAGFSGEETPRATFPAAIGRPRRRRNSSPASAQSEETKYIGVELNECEDDRDILDVVNPIQYGKVVDWDDMETLLGYAYYKHLKVSPDEQPLMVTEPPRNPRANRERLAQLLFETFEVPATFVSMPAVLSVIATGRVRGIGVDCGHGCLQAVPVFDGTAIPHTMQRGNVAGHLLDESLSESIYMEYGQSLNATYAGQEILQKIKETMCYVAPNSDLAAFQAGDGPQSMQQTVELPDGTSVTLTNELYRCPESLFNPVMLNLGVPEEDTPGIHRHAFSAIQKCDIDIRKEMYSNVVLSGRTTFLPGFVDRFETELKAIAPPAASLNIVAAEDRGQTVWVGGSILAQLSNFETSWVSRQEYNETGQAILHKRCPY